MYKTIKHTQVFSIPTIMKLQQLFSLVELIINELDVKIYSHEFAE
jgi:hypothetical protein